jgi:large subunit ribosomal protein L13
MTDKLIIDATNTQLGRLASHTAKQALLGKSLIIVNCNDAIISGRKSTIIDEYKQTRSRSSSSLKGPHFPKSPERIVKRTIRGMLSYKQTRGSQALKRILCYNTTPKEYEGSQTTNLKFPIATKTIKLKELSNVI